MVPRGAADQPQLRDHSFQSCHDTGEPWLADQEPGSQRCHQVLSGGAGALAHQPQRVLQPRRVLRRAAQVRQGAPELQPHGALRPALRGGLQQHGGDLQGAGQPGQGPQVLPHCPPMQPTFCTDPEQPRCSVHHDGPPPGGAGAPLARRGGRPRLRRGLQQPWLALLGPRRFSPGLTDVRTLHRAVTNLEEPLTEPSACFELLARGLCRQSL
mmetsp:Transcript_95255/g.278468  ORF Transcript_95255/g.278468 Transcript_95255/m.278468 type:complete len:212 (-) Transcript_95255:1291-1926(-)